MKTGRAFFVPFSLAVLCSSCSFDYTDEMDRSAPMPEIVLSGVTARRYENLRETVAIKADALEIYDGDSMWAGKGVSFVQYAEDGTVQAEGASGLLLIDNTTETYALGDAVSFRSVPDDMVIEATDLRWEKKTHWLAGPQDGEVHIKKGDGTDVRGSGLFADTLSWTYAFRDSVKGDLNGNNLDAQPDGDAAQ